MRCTEGGHIYLLDDLDGEAHQKVVFVNRNKGQEHEGTNNQEVIRMLIDRVEFLDNQLHWRGNTEIIQHLRMALVLHESRHLERLTERSIIKPENVLIGENGHFIITAESS